MANMTSSTNVNNLSINIVDTNATFTEMQNNDQVNANELYFITEEVAPSSLKIELNGTTATYDTTSATTLTSFYAPTSVGTSGYILKSNGNGAPVWAAPYSYTLTTATTAALGGIKIGYTTTGQNYAVQLSDGKAYVNVPWENTTYIFDGTYNASSNKAATVATVTNAINALDVTAITSGAANTITSISETNGKISATYSAISIAPSQINAAIPNSKLATSGISIAGTQVALDGSITADTLRENLNLSQALRFIGVTSAGVADGNNTIPTDLGITNYEPSVGDVVIDSSTQYEYVWVKGTGFLTGRWEKLGGDSSYKTVQNVVSAATTASNTTATRFVTSINQNSNGVISYTTQPLPTYNNYSLPLAANGTRGGIQIGYTTSGKNYAVQLSSEKAYVNVPWTDTWDALSTSKAGYVAKAPNSTSQFLRGDATWAAVTKANVGLGNVENTALSTWTGSTAITSIGTLSTGTVPWARLSNVPTASTTTAGIVQLSSATNSTSTALAATPSAVKAAYDLANSKTSNTGTVTSVATGTGLSGGPITTSGTISLSAATTSTIGGVILSNTAGSDITTDTAAIGTSTAVARADHTHKVTTATTAVMGVVQLSSATNSTSNSFAATPAAVKAAYDLANSKTSNTGTVTSIIITNGSGIAINSTAAITTSGSRTISLATITTSTTTSTAAPAHGGTFTAVDSITFDNYGRISNYNTKTITLPADSNTDTKVSQSATTTSSWHKVLLHYTADSSSTASVTSTTNVVYGAQEIAAQPDTGTLRANVYNIADAVSLVFDATTQALNFVFV